MAWMGFCRNGRVSVLSVGSIEAVKRNVSVQREVRRWLNEVRIVDDQGWQVWFVGPDGQWYSDTIDRHLDDPVVDSVLAKTGRWPVMNPVRQFPKEHGGERYREPERREPEVEGGRAPGIVVDNRDWTRSRPRGRRARARH